MKTNPLVALGRAGQSPWIDYIHRGMIASGELARRIAEDGIRGVTSNPTIFEKAVSSGSDYDAQIRALARAGAKLLEAYKAIVTDDIRAAADVLRPVYDATRGDDGYVSLEVDPDLARDTRATIARARELFDAVGRPNVMIKIPGTKEGLPAVEETIAAGIPVNVTLIFSVRRYEEVAEAYLRGEAPNHTLQPTALVHEVFLRLVESDTLEWRGRAQFIALAATQIRKVLVDHARRRGAIKRGANFQRSSLTLDSVSAEVPTVDLLSLDDALASLAARSPRQSEVVELRFFGGLSTAEVADVLKVSERTVKDDWKAARAWLRQDMER